MAQPEGLTVEEQVGVLADLYTQRAETYDSLWSPVIRPLGERLIDRIQLSDATRVLDVGTGAGALLPAIQRAASEAIVLGVDRSAGMLRLARRRYAGPLVVMDAQSLALQDGVFEAAIAAFVLFHLPHPDQCLADVHRVLRHGGSVGTVTWATEEFPIANTVWDEELEAAGATAPILTATDSRGSCNTAEKVAAMLSAAGFREIDAWIDSVDHRWRPEDSFEYHIRSTAFARLQSLSSAERELCLRRVTDRLSALDGDGYWFRGMVVMATATKP
jgi:ubiquinone/menaquinone biosynthesis C-methylase UbiE